MFVPSFISSFSLRLAHSDRQRFIPISSVELSLPLALHPHLPGLFSALRWQWAACLSSTGIREVINEDKQLGTPRDSQISLVIGHRIPSSTGLSYRPAVFVGREGQKRPCVPFTPLTPSTLLQRKPGAEILWKNICPSYRDCAIQVVTSSLCPGQVETGPAKKKSDGE